MMFLKPTLKSLSLFCLSALLVITVLADDTDIYTTGSSSSPAVVDGYVMLMMESRPSLGSTLCSDVTASSCETTLTTQIYNKVTSTTDGLAITSGKVDLTDALRAVYLVLLPELKDIGNFHIGMMLSHDDTCKGAGPSYIPSGNNKGCSNGGYIIRGFEPIRNDTSRAELETIIKSFPRGANGHVAHKYQGKELYFEYFRYLTGQEVWNGALGFDDFASSNDHLNLGEAGNAATDVVPDLLPSGDRAHELDPDTTILDNSNIEASGVKYVSPFAGNASDFTCTKVYAINNMVGVADAGSDSNGEIEKTLAKGGMDGLSGNFDFEDVIARMYALDVASPNVGVDIEGNQNVISYIVAPKPHNTENSYAAAGGTDAALESSDPAALLESLRQVFNDIAIRSSTLVAASVPVNVFNRADIVDNVFLAIFEVNDDGYPFWPGNLKKLKLQERTVNGDTFLSIVDANGAAGFNPLDGRISTSAVTFWTKTSELPDAVDDRREIDDKDGRAVTMGGAGQQIPGYKLDNSAHPGYSNSDAGARQLYVEPATVSNTAAAGNTLLALNATSTSFNHLVQTSDTTTAAKHLQWLRGLDPELYNGNTDDLDEDNDIEEPRSYIHLDTDDNGTQDFWRPWLLGSAIHSRPLAINYGARPGYDVDGADNNLGTSDDEAPDVRIFMGTNDGFMHQFQNTDPSGGESGVEKWAFIPRELMDNVDLLRQQGSIVPMHPYGVDGAPVAFVIDNNGDGTITHSAGCATGANDCDKVYLYFGLRRGGKSYYALDVSDPDSAPKLLWRLRKPDTFSGSNGSYAASASSFAPGDTLEPGRFNEGTLTISGSDYNVLYNTAKAVILDGTLPGSMATNVSFTLTSPGDSDFAELGLTFSTPRTGWIKYQSSPTPVLFFAGGYYGGWKADHSGRIGKDDLTHTGSDSEGSAIFIVHARTGELLWKAVPSGTTSDTVYVNSGLTDSIASDLTIMDSDANNIVDRIYVGDTGGTVWRFDLTEGDDCSGNDQRRCWFASKLATLGDTAGNGGADDRRFFHAPRVVQSRDSSNFDAVLIGTGDRAHPKVDTSSGGYVNNFFFMLKDRLTTSGDRSALSRTPLKIGDLYDATDNCVDSSCSDSDISNGWKLILEEDGEKNLSSPLVIAGNVFFTTYLPGGSSGTGSCVATVGSSRLYVVSFRNAAPVFHFTGTADDVQLVKTDRYIDDVEGIGGDVIALTPEFVMTPGGKIYDSGSEGVSATYWREEGLDNIQH